MSSFSLPDPFDDDSGRQSNFLELLRGLNQIAQFIDFGTGAPTHSPAGPALYFREDGGVGSSIYGWDTATWTALV